MKLYARYGIAHFWIVDPEARTVEALELDGNLYRLVAAYGAEDKARSSLFPTLEIDLAAAWF